jgi:hypothetical protein
MVATARLLSKRSKQIKQINDLNSCVCDLAECLELLTSNAKVATVLGSIAAYYNTVKSEGRQMKYRSV